MTTTLDPHLQAAPPAPDELPPVEDTATAQLSEADQKALAGVSEIETTNALIPEEFKITPDTTQAADKETSQKPFPQMLFVTGLVGIVVGFGAFMVLALNGSGGRSQAPQIAEEEPQITVAEEDTETAALRSRLALMDQQASMKQQATTPAQPQVKPSPAAVRPASAPTATPVRTVAPAPRPYSPPPVRTMPAPHPAAAAAAAPVDPFARWSQLASLGLVQSASPVANSLEAAVPLPLPTESSTASASSANSEQKQFQFSQIPEVQLVQAMSASTLQSVADSPGARGILQNRRPTVSQPRVIEIGTMVRASVVMPLVMDSSLPAGQAAPLEGMNRFTVKLDRPIQANDGTVVIPAGALLIAEVAHANPSSGAVVATVNQATYRDASGQVVRQNLPEGAVLIRGEEGNPLIAKNAQDSGGSIAAQDVLIGALGALGTIGQVINQPRSQTTTIGNGFSQTSTDSDPEVWAAALQGAFGITSERLSERSDRMIDQMINRPAVLVLEEGTELTVVVNSIMTL